ncbi:hypothetical protein CAPTEDRAFT_206087 [Capitella teleta]|uniref:Uncharacterized protein n=1 Tax=Capitella teleta TaxID=283909 RepID=R7U117_CAPTE|nr:hypothetical protein CAPTEDRAFT_206087 [Capitella teleta]|eukprot:ELT97321.1 hypothetical protein CAPTEDRAFT_206087 [Capitella teleta]
MAISASITEGGRRSDAPLITIHQFRFGFQGNRRLSHAPRSRRLQVQFDDDHTTRRNKSRLYATHVVTIQRAWREFLKRRRQACPEDDLSSDTSSGIVALSSPEDDLASDPPPAMTAVVKHDVTQLPKETDSDFAKRVRKISYLSLAQEFAALQDTESRFDEPPESPMSECSMVDSGTGSSPLDVEPDCNLNLCRTKQRSLDNRKEEKCDMFDVYNIESTLPQVDWNMLEEHLHRSAEEQKQMFDFRGLFISIYRKFDSAMVSFSLVVTCVIVIVLLSISCLHQATLLGVGGGCPARADSADTAAARCRHMAVNWVVRRRKCRSESDSTLYRGSWAVDAMWIFAERREISMQAQRKMG